MCMEFISLAAFQTWLFLKIGWSISRMILLLLAGVIFSFSPILAIGIWVIIFFLIWKGPILFKPTTIEPSASQTKQMSLDQQIQFWESARAQQPTDRDILLNLAHLYAAQGNQDLAKSYTNQAHEVDPNFSY